MDDTADVELKNALLSLFPYYSSSSSDGGDEDKTMIFVSKKELISHERCAMERNLGWSFFTATKQRRKMDGRAVRANEAMEARMFPDACARTKLLPHGVCQYGYCLCDEG